MRKTILTPEKLELVQQLVSDGQSAVKIAETVGCTVGTLRVICCKNDISLRRKKEVTPKPVPPCQLKIHVPEFIYLNLNDHAIKKGITRSTLVSRLLEQIATDNLYQAVLDD